MPQRVHHEACAMGRMQLVCTNRCEFSTGATWAIPWVAVWCMLHGVELMCVWPFRLEWLKASRANNFTLIFSTLIRYCVSCSDTNACSYKIHNILRWFEVRY